MEFDDILSRITIIKGDITSQSVDAIVNAANSSLLGGGGVDGAIHSSAGPGLLEECRKLHGCRTGQAKITNGYDLLAKHVIHTVGPVYKNGTTNEALLLASCYKNSLSIASEHDIKTIAFPAISTGIYGYPKKEACQIAIKTTIEFLKNNNTIREVRFILFDDVSYNLYLKEISRYASNNS
ncbi:MAG: O-acetyl-ADP-ribose deacetylase [Candidatus Coatesbacteria bacterium]|nr:O-acetyl-ADP-ribose deacetylase [Candidatus Coatesbacteria bacterium]